MTTVTYNIENGEIYDADMEVNSAKLDLTTGDTNVIFDLQSIATHEAGHFLGLSHSSDHDATMTTEYTPGSTELRDLSPDDRAAICDAYPPGDAIPSSCDTTPRHGFSSVCAKDVKSEDPAGGCSVKPASPNHSPRAGVFGAFLAGLLGLLFARSRAARAGCE